MFSSSETFTEDDLQSVNTVCVCDDDVRGSWVGSSVVATHSSMSEVQNAAEISETTLLKVTFGMHVSPMEGHGGMKVYEALSTG